MAPGLVRAGDSVYRTSRPHPDWPLARLSGAIANRDTAPELLREILSLPLPPSWRKLFARRLESGMVESWRSRIEGPGRPSPAPSRETGLRSLSTRGPLP